MRARFVAAIAIVVALATGVSVAAARTVVEDNSRHVTMTANQAGNPLGTPYLAHCQHNNPYPYDMLQQLAFLDHHPMTVTEDAANGFVWLDYEANEPGDPGLTVRYYAGAGGTHPCTFALMQTNHPDEDAVTQRFTRDGKPFTPTRDQFCYSKRPPALLPIQADYAVATLACDFLEG